MEWGGGGFGFIYSKALSNVRIVPNHMDVSSFEFLITFSLHLQNIRMATLYRPGHPGTDRAFMEEFGQFLEILSVCREKLLICGDFNYWLDNPSLKPYTNEFMSLLDINPFTPTRRFQRHLFFIHGIRQDVGNIKSGKFWEKIHQKKNKKTKAYVTTPLAERHVNRWHHRPRTGKFGTSA